MREDTTKPAPDPELRRARVLAVTSLVCGSASVFLLLFLMSRHTLMLLPFLAVPAIVCGHRARRRLAKNLRCTADSRFALAGLIMAYLSVAVVLCLFLALLPAREEARRQNCIGNLHGIGIACKMYATDYDGAYPPDWKILWDMKYLDAPKIYLCPSTQSTPPTDSTQLADPKHCDYVYFGAGQIDLGPGSAKTVLIADRTGNHKGFWNIIFRDGHMEGLTAAPGTDFATAVRGRGWILPGAAKKP